MRTADTPIFLANALCPPAIAAACLSAVTGVSFSIKQSLTLVNRKNNPCEKQMFYPHRMKFGNRLEIALTVMEWTVTDLARICNVADTTIGAIIRRNSDRSNYSEQIIKAFPPDKVSHEWLRSGVGSAKPKPVDEFTERRLSGSVRSAGIDVLLERLSHHLTLMDAGSKRRAGLLLSDLANAPGDHASIAAAMAAMCEPSKAINGIVIDEPELLLNGYNKRNNQK